LQDRLGGQQLKHRPGNNHAVRDVESVAKLGGRAADDDMLVPQPPGGSGISAQDVGVRQDRHAVEADAKVDLKRGFAAWVVRSSQHHPQRRNELTIEYPSDRIAPDDSARFYGDVDDSGPGVLGKLLKRAIDVKGPRVS